MAGRRERQEQGGFAIRLREVVDAYGSASALAKAIARSEGAVRKWLRGESEPNVTDLRALCEETRTRIEWLVTGHGKREVPLGVQESPAVYEDAVTGKLNYTLVEEVIRAVDEELQSAGLTLPSTKRAMLVVAVYDGCRERKELDREAVRRLVRLAG